MSGNCGIVAVSTSNAGTLAKFCLKVGPFLPGITHVRADTLRLPLL
jgi:hypothetical protein